MLPVFQVGDSIMDDRGRNGTIFGVRDDAYEQACRRRDPRHGYYYHVHYANGKFDTYVPGYTLSLHK